MTKEVYEEKLELLKTAQVELRNEYIETNKPCNIDDHVEIVLASGRIVRGWVREFGILADKKVCITTYSETDADNTLKQRYITTPHGKVTII